jgi:prevent-host-death family protein
MIRINIFEAKAKLSTYLDRLAQGEQVIICRRNRPVAELRPIAAVRAEPRPIGGAKGMLVVPESFFDPLPDDFVDSFHSDASGYLPRPASTARRPAVGRGTSNASKRPAAVASRPRRRRRS